MVTELAADQAGSGTGKASTGDAGGPHASKARSHRAALIIFGLVAVAVLIIDIVTKQLAVAHLTEGDPVRWLGGAIYLSLTRNGGAAFSMGTSITWVFPLISIVVVGWIVWMTVKLRSLAWAVALGLVFGGALGNVGDRLFREPGVLRGHVVDFISLFSPYGSHFAIFNMADAALTTGVALAVLLELLGRRRDGSIVRDGHESRAGVAQDGIKSGNTGTSSNGGAPSNGTTSGDSSTPSTSATSSNGSASGKRQEP